MNLRLRPGHNRDVMRHHLRMEQPADPSLCGRRDGDFPCDRPAGHSGGCAGRLLELDRLEREYRWAVEEIGRLRRRAVEAESRAGQLERAVRLHQEAASRSRLRRLFQ